MEGSRGKEEEECDKNSEREQACSDQASKPDATLRPETKDDKKGPSSQNPDISYSKARQRRKLKEALKLAPVERVVLHSKSKGKKLPEICVTRIGKEDDPRSMRMFTIGGSGVSMSLGDDDFSCSS